MRAAIVGICSLTLAAVAYLSLSLIILRPPRANIAGWVPIAIAVAGASVAAIAAAAAVRAPGALRVGALTGAVVLLALGVWMIRGTLQSSHFEGYQVVLGAMLIAQGLITGVGLQVSRPA